MVIDEQFSNLLKPKRRNAFTIVELLVACALVMLFCGLVLPAISGSREAARRIACTHQMQQIGLALHEHDEVYASLPAGWIVESTGTSAFGWFVRLLPFCEQASLASRIDVARPLAHRDNAEACRASLAMAICPSDVAEPLFALYQETGDHERGSQQSEIVLMALASSNYIGVFGTRDPDDVSGPTGDGAFLESRSIRFAELERGLSATMLIGERTARKLPSAWIGFAIDGEDGRSRVVGFAGMGPNRDDADESEFSSRHPGCANFLWADGHVASVSDSIDRQLYKRFAARSMTAN